MHFKLIYLVEQLFIYLCIPINFLFSMYKQNGRIFRVILSTFYKYYHYRYYHKYHQASILSSLQLMLQLTINGNEASTCFFRFIHIKRQNHRQNNKVLYTIQKQILLLYNVIMSCQNERIINTKIPRL